MILPAARQGCWVVLLWIVFHLGLVSLVPGRGMADGLKGAVEYGYNFSETETRSGVGETRRSETQNVGQRYRLNFDKSLYPNLVLRGGGLFERQDVATMTDAAKTDSTSTRLRPFADLTLSSPPYTAGAGFSRVEEESSGTTLVREFYNGMLAWRPVDLPSANFRYSRTDTFDPGRQKQNLTTEIVQIGSSYQPIRSINLSYQGTWNQSEDRLGGVETRDMTHTGRIAYEERLWDGKFSLATNYNISNRRSRVSATRGGEVTVQVLPFSGLSALDDTPLQGELTGTPALVNGNLTSGAGIDIGLPSPGDPQGSAPRNLGLDFLQSDVEVNGLLVWVDRTLPPQVASPFRWDVYISQNNLDWTLWQTVVSAPFGPFVDRFEVRFPTVRTRYVKAVVAPLSPTVIGALGFPDIFVTELQANLTRPAEEVEARTSQTTHLANISARAKLLGDPSLYYDFSLIYSLTKPGAASRLFLTNSLSAYRRFNQWLSGSAQAARDDVDEPAGKQQAYRCSISLNATPLKTLSHSIVYSGRRENLVGGTNARNSVFINNRASLYQGIDVLLNGGVSDGRDETGAKTRSYLVNAGSEIAPHRTLTFSLSYSADRSERSGGGQPDSTTSTRQARAAAAWNPTPALSVYAATAALERTEGSTSLHNWALNWSPFRDGSLQASFSYSESLRPEEDGTDRLIAPSLRWEVRRGTTLDLSYTVIHSKTRSEETDSSVISANLLVNF